MSTRIEANTSPYVPVQEGLINTKLPTELFQITLSYLSFPDMCSALEVSKNWHFAVIQIVRSQDHAFINEFVKFVCENANHELYAQQIKNLADLTNKTRILTSVSLQEVKIMCFEFEEKILVILQNFKKEDLTLIEKKALSEDKPRFFNHMIKLAKIYRKRGYAELTLDENTRGNMLNMVCLELANISEYDKAANTAKTIKDVDVRDKTLESTCMLAAQNQKFRKAQQIVKIITNERVRERSLRSISVFLCCFNKIIESIEVARSIKDVVIRDQSLWDIFFKLMENGELGRAHEISQEITDVMIRRSTFFALESYTVKRA